MPHALTPALRRTLHAAGLAAALALAGGVQAQQGGAAKPATAPAPAPAPAATATATATPLLSSPLPEGAGTVVPPGTGAGYHSPNSPIAPLPQRNDVVPWSVLTDLGKKTTKNGIVPVFSSVQKGMNKTTQRLQGFMMPLKANRTAHSYFLLTSVPLTCSFCIPGGPESMIEVKAKTPVPYSLEPVVVEGTFTLLHDDQYGLFYRLVDAVPVK